MQVLATAAGVVTARAVVIARADGLGNVYAYNPGQPRKPKGDPEGGEWDDGRTPGQRRADALRTYNKVDGEKSRFANANARRLAKILGLKHTDDNDPMDTIGKTRDGRTLGVEIKTMTDQANRDSKMGKATIHKDSMARKVEWRAKTKAVTRMVISDKRDVYKGGRYSKYHSGHELWFYDGLGSPRLGTRNIVKVKDGAHLKQLVFAARHKK